MIRVNLLPVRQVRKVQARRRQLLIFVALIAAQILGMFVLYQQQLSVAEQHKRNIQVLQTEIEQLKSQVGDFDKLKEQRDRLMSQRKVINSLQSARKGPVAVLRELSEILSVGKGPTVDQTQYEELIRRDPNAGYNPRWPPRRLWIERLDERDKRISVQGKAKDHDDVAELLKRLALSRLFENVELKRNEQVVDRDMNLKVIRFSLSFVAKY